MKDVWVPYLVLVSTLIHQTTCQLRLPICVVGALFNENSFMRNAFSLAILTLNECNYNTSNCEHMCPCEEGINCWTFHRIEFKALMLSIEDDLLISYEKLGQLAGHNVKDHNYYGLAAIFGPHYALTGRYIQGLCEIHDLPNIVIRRELDHDRIRSINLYPELQTLSTMYVKMVEKLNWTSFSILYEGNEDFLALDNVLKMYGPYDHAVYAFQLGTGLNYSQPLLRAKETGHKSFIIDCSHETLASILKQTQEVGMMTEAYKYIVTSMDLQTIDLRPYQHSGVNISGIRIFNSDDPFVRNFVSSHLEEFGITRVEELRTEEALMFDAVALFGQAYKDLSYQYEMYVASQLPSKYDEPSPWHNGLSLRNYILYNSISGLTGPVMLDSDGARRRFKVDILNLHKTGLTKVGMWNPDDGFDDLNLMNEIKITHFKVLITMTRPYAMKVNFSKNMEGNERYEGFVVDIIKELSKMIGFNYTFYVQEDSKNGMCNKTNEKCSCTGMMQQIQEGKVHMAITDLTITEEREQCVDFSTSFWNLGMSILYKKPANAPPTLFSFLSPFQMNVWLYLAGTFIFVSLLFFVLGRMSPGEWNNPFPCIDEPTELHNQFNIKNAFWFTIGAIMQQGSEIAPISNSTRTLAGYWFCFCLIIVSTYTANLAAFLTIESPVKVIRGIEDLYNQSEIKFGAKLGGSTIQYFESSKDPKHRKLADKMRSKEWKKWMVESNEQGIELAEKENYAFLMESSSIEYIQYRFCTLEQAGPLIDQKSYAIAYKKDFEYHHQISSAISLLQESLVIKALYDKWWKEKGAACFKESNSPEPMNLDQLAGIFWVLGIGIVVSWLITISEFFLDAQTVSKKENVPLTHTLNTELKFIAKCKPVKPVLRRGKSSESRLSDDYSCNFTMTTQT